MRLDVALVDRGLVRSRSRAAELIETGKVTVAGKIATKASADVADTVNISVDDDGWVSRAAYKLIGALTDSGVAVKGRALDAGASTGGFTQVLLSQGCSEVVAVDVGHGQLDESLREDPRVIVKEGLNLRDMTLADVGNEPVDVVTADVSFISLTLILEQLLGVLRPDGVAILLVKPQFELGKKTRKVKGGVVRSEALRQQAVDGVLDEAQRLGWRQFWQGDSVLAGQDGNVEHVVVLKHRSTFSVG
ncbi:MAG: TlyA family RNA methyltransferase [Propionibacteriaceae bacterium]